MSIAELSSLTGRDHRTVANQLAAGALIGIGKKGRAVLYDSELALRVLFKAGESAKARLDVARAEIAELDLAERRGELLRGDVVKYAQQRRESAARARFLAIPSKIAGQFAPPGKLQQAEDAITAAIYEALAELAGDGVDGDR